MTITLLALDMLSVILVLFLLLYVLCMITNVYAERAHWRTKGLFDDRVPVRKSAKELEAKYTLLRRRLTQIKQRKLGDQKVAAPRPK
jgi:hypothetical protein